MKCSECSFFNGQDCDQLPGELEDPVCLQRVLVYSNLRQEHKLQRLEFVFHSIAPPSFPKELHQKMQRYIEKTLTDIDDSESWKTPDDDEEEFDFK